MKVVILFIVAVAVFCSVGDEAPPATEDCKEWTLVKLDCAECLKKEVTHEVLCDEWKTTDTVCTGLKDGVNGYMCSSKGDPHFSLSVNTEIYDNFIRGDVIMARSTNLGKPFDLHTRQDMWGLASVNIGLALKLTNDFVDIIIYEKNKGLFLKQGHGGSDASVTKEPLVLAIGETRQIAGGSITHILANDPLKTKDRYKIVSDTGIKVDFFVKQEMKNGSPLTADATQDQVEDLFINIILLVPADMQHDIYGLCSLTHPKFAYERDAVGLFEDTFDPADPVELDPLPDTTSNQYEDALRKCQGLEGSLLEMCIFDVLQTTNDDLADQIIDGFIEYEDDLNNDSI